MQLKCKDLAMQFSTNQRWGRGAKFNLHNCGMFMALKIKSDNLIYSIDGHFICFNFKHYAGQTLKTSELHKIA